ncbi:MAG: LPS export ABC transporter permease LptF [Desulfobulbaceae bacterium]|nr:LPS export ABC transporter permease LptF [Desulfobulbaceae bacterium]
MILDRYILRTILQPTIIICTILVCIFASFMAARYWEDAANGLLSAGAVFTLILLRVLIALEVLLPTTLYLSVVLALGTLHNKGEMLAMSASGITALRISRPVVLLAVAIGVLVSVFSLYIRPWAWTQFFHLKTQAQANFDLSHMQDGIFYENGDGNRVIFASAVDGQKTKAQNIFFIVKRNDALRVVYAHEAAQLQNESHEDPVVSLRDGRLYEFAEQGDKGLVLEFNRAALLLQPQSPLLTEYRVKAAPTGALFNTEKLEEVAELQWRLVTPLSCVFLAILAIPLSQASRRQGQQARLPLAILIFALAYNLGAVTKKMVAHGELSAFPGVFWSQLFLPVCLVLLVGRAARFRFRQRV